MSEWEKMNTFDNRIEMAQLFSWVPLEPHQIYHMVVYLDHSSSSLVGSQTSKKVMSTNSKTKLGFPLNLAFGLLKQQGRFGLLEAAGDRWFFRPSSFPRGCTKAGSMQWSHRLGATPLRWTYPNASL